MLRLAFLVILLCGGALFTYSLSEPYFKNGMTISEFNNAHINGNYYKDGINLRTKKNLFMDIGAGLSIASITMLFFSFGFNIVQPSDLNHIKSLDKKYIFITANLAWLFLIPGTYWYYTFRGSRGDYPPFADSIAIPIFYQTIAILIMLIPLNIFLGVITYKSALPSAIFVKATRYKKGTIFLETLFGFLMLINIAALVFFVIDGDHVSIIIDLIFTYIILSLRAGRINKLGIDAKIFGI